MESIISAEIIATILWLVGGVVGCVVLFWLPTLLGIVTVEEFGGAALGIGVGLVLSAAWGVIAAWQAIDHGIKLVIAIVGAVSG